MVLQTIRTNKSNSTINSNSTRSSSSGTAIRSRYAPPPTKSKAAKANTPPIKPKDTPTKEKSRLSYK